MAASRSESSTVKRLMWRLLLLICMGANSAHAHELQPGFLQLNESAQTPSLYEVLWKQPLNKGEPLRLTPVFPADCALTAQPHVERLEQSQIFRAQIRCESPLAGKTLAMEGLEALSTDVLIRIAHAGGAVETHQLKPDSPRVTLAESGPRGALTYFTLGVEHIALGIDHLLFVLGLLLLVDSRAMLFKTITSFTIAHSITLALATLVRIDVPAGALNACIALSILFLAPEVVRRWRGQSSLTLRHPWLVAFLFGLLHGFGFASGLANLGLPADEIPLALLLFNVGVEAGQLGFVALVFALRAAAASLQIVWHAHAHKAPAYLLGSLGAYWTIQRTLMMFGIKF
jgi:hypothetical protein